MRRSLARIRSHPARPGSARIRESRREQFHLRAESREFLRKFEHRFVLLRHVMLQVSNLLLDALNAFVHVGNYDTLVAMGFARRIFSSSGWITFV